MAWTGAFARSSLLDHWLNQLLISGISIRQADRELWGLLTAYSGASVVFHSQTVWPSRLISRTNFLLLAARIFPFDSGVADQIPGTSTDQSAFPSKLYSTAFSKVHVRNHDCPRRSHSRVAELAMSALGVFSRAAQIYVQNRRCFC